MFSFVPLQRSDYPLLSEWLRQPHVAAWWADDPDLAALELQYGDCIDGKEACHGFLACYDQEPIGLVQYFLLAAYPEYAAEIAEHVVIPQGSASMDYMIGVPKLVNRGLGTRMLDAFVKKIFAEASDASPEVTHILVPTHLDNKASWGVLEKIGFERMVVCKMEPDNPEHSKEHDHSADHVIYIRSR